MRLSKKTLGAVAASITAVVAFGIFFSSLITSDFTSEEELQLAARWLDEGRWDLAQSLADELEPLVDTQTNSTWNYVQGVSLLTRIIDDLDSYQNRIILAEAIEHLEKSGELGFPLGYSGKGNYYLGVCFFNTYRWEEAIESLSRSLTEHPETRSDSMRMIITAHLRKPKPSPEDSKAVLERWVRMPGLSDREMAQTYLAHAQLALQSKKPQECIRWLDSIQPGIPEYFESLTWRSLWYIRQSQDAPQNSSLREEKLKEAQRDLQRLIVAADTPMQLRRRSQYLSGRVLRYLGRYQEAVSTLSGVRQNNPFSAEAIAAGLEEAEILVDMGKLNEVPPTTRQLLYGISDIRLYNEYWLPADELRTRLIEIGNRLRVVEEYELALEISDQLIIAFPANYALRLQANILSNWASAMERENSPDDVQARAVRADLFARAGECCEKLARLELRSRDYLNIVWTAIENYQLAGRIDDANRMIQDSLKYESRSKHPRALLAIGKNHIAKGDWQACLAPLNECLTEFPSSPNSYEARLLAARAMMELNDLDRAIELLSANLWDYELHPNSPIWKDSYVELAGLLFQRGQRSMSAAQSQTDIPWKDIESSLRQAYDHLRNAADHLREAASRYPDDPRRNYLRFQLARAYQLAAQLPHQTVQFNQTLSESAKRLLLGEKSSLLEKSAIEYESLHRAIIAQSESSTSHKLDASIIRAAYFGQADVLADSERFEEAIEAYRSAAAYYSNRPEALEALVQIAECFRKMGKEEDAKRTVRQAELVLQRIPVDRDAAFVSTTRGDRKHWENTLDRLKDWN